MICADGIKCPKCYHINFDIGYELGPHPRSVECPKCNHTFQAWCQVTTIYYSEDYQ